MLTRTRLAAAAAALAVPAAALATVLPATAAQAATYSCARNQAQITFSNNSQICQGPGRVSYFPLPPTWSVTKVCTGWNSMATVYSLGGTQSLTVHQCVTFERSLADPVTVSVTWVP